MQPTVRGRSATIHPHILLWYPSPSWTQYSGKIREIAVTPLLFLRLIVIESPRQTMITPQPLPSLPFHSITRHLATPSNPPHISTTFMHPISICDNLPLPPHPHRPWQPMPIRNGIPFSLTTPTIGQLTTTLILILLRQTSATSNNHPPLHLWHSLATQDSPHAHLLPSSNMSHSDSNTQASTRLRSWRHPQLHQSFQGKKNANSPLSHIITTRSHPSPNPRHRHSPDPLNTIQY